MPTQSDISRLHTLRPGESHAALRTAARHCHTPDPRPSSPTHPDTPPGSRPSHAQLVPGPQDKSWLHPRDSLTLLVPEPWPLPRDTPRPPARCQGRKLAGSAPSCHVSAASAPTLLAGVARPPAKCRGRTGGSGCPASLPHLFGQPGVGREVVGGAWVPAGAPASYPAPTGQEAGPGEASSGLPAPSPTGLGQGSMVRGRERDRQTYSPLPPKSLDITHVGLLCF